VDDALTFEVEAVEQAKPPWWKKSPQRSTSSIVGWLEVAGEHKLIVQPTVALFRLFILLSSKLTTIPNVV
jgi:hypothetical protein